MNIFRMIKCGILFSAAAVTVAVCCSCGSKNNYNSKVHINEALRHMNNKYGVEFTYDSDNTKKGSSGIFGKEDSYVNIIVTCKQLPDIPIVVYSSDGSEYLDDLVPKKYEHQAQSDLNLIAKTVFDGDVPTVKLSLNTENEMAERTLPAETTYEDFKLSGALGLVEIYTDDSDAPLEDYRLLADTMAGNDMNCQPSVYYFGDNSYENIAADKPGQAFVGNDKKMGHIGIKNDACIIDEDFDGEIMIDELYAMGADAVYLQLFNADNEDTAAYDAMFVMHGGDVISEETGESSAESAEDISEQ